MQKFCFFRCYHCGTWYYSNRVIKVKKCLKCHHTFQFRKTSKFYKKGSMSDAIAIIKELKKRSEAENLTKYINLKNDLVTKYPLKDKKT